MPSSGGLERPPKRSGAKCRADEAGIVYNEHPMRQGLRWERFRWLPVWVAVVRQDLSEQDQWRDVGPVKRGEQRWGAGRYVCW